MGRDKLGLTVGGKKLIERVYGVLQSRCEEVLVVGSADQKRPSPEYLTEARYIFDSRPGRIGPLAGIEAALANARNEHVFIGAADMPFIPENMVAALFELVEGDEGVRVAVPSHDGRIHPLCAVYSREVLVELSFALNMGARAVHTFLENLDGVRHIEEELELFGDPERFLMNVNSLEDLELARRLSEAQGI